MPIFCTKENNYGYFSYGHHLKRNWNDVFEDILNYFIASLKALLYIEDILLHILIAKKLFPLKITSPTFLSCCKEQIKNVKLKQKN